jgi:hypothetical protein
MQSLTLQLPEKTLRKLRAFAMLSGSTVDQIESELAEYFDQMLSESIMSLLGVATPPPAAEVAEERPVAAAVDEESDTSGHSLAAEDQEEEEGKALDEEDIQPFEIDVPEAKNEDAFVDAALAGEKKRRPAPHIPGNPISPSKSFDPTRRKARISEYTGDDAVGPMGV